MVGQCISCILPLRGSNGAHADAGCVPHRSFDQGGCISRRPQPANTVSTCRCGTTTCPNLSMHMTASCRVSTLSDPSEVEGHSQQHVWICSLKAWAWSEVRQQALPLNERTRRPHCARKGSGQSSGQQALPPSKRTRSQHTESR